MDAVLALFHFPFMQRAIIAGAFLGILFACLGVLATLRKMTFFGEGVAHASLAGIAIAILAGVAPLPFAMAWAVIIAIVIFFLERSTKLASDTVIGILFTASMALGVILMNFSHGFQPELLSFLFGSILAIQTIDLIVIGVTSTIILAWFFTYLRQLTFLSLNQEGAYVAGVPVIIQTLMFYIALAISTVLGVKILGIILVSALLVLPAATSRMLAGTFRSYLIIAIVVAELIIFSGLAVSFYLDLPSGATIVLVGTGLFTLAAVYKHLK